MLCTPSHCLLHMHQSALEQIRHGAAVSPACPLRCTVHTLQVLGRLSESFTEPLQAYQTGSSPTRAGEWDAKGVAWLGPFK